MWRALLASPRRRLRCRFRAVRYRYPWGGVHLPHPVPPLIQAHHRLLGEFIGLSGTAGEEVEGPGEANMLRLEELLEAEVGHRSDLLQRSRGFHRWGFHHVNAW
jgi:hypothetical protein